MMKSGQTTTYEREQPPGKTTNDDLKSFMTKLAENHDKFCDSCKSLITEALS
jgi:hypothetical protein